MNIGGALGVANSMAHNFDRSTDENYRVVTTQETIIKEASLTEKKEAENPYKEQGVPNFIWQIFNKVTEKTDMYTQKSIEHKLFGRADEKTNWSDHLSQLKKSMEKPITAREVDELIEEKNIILEQFNQPKMSPSEEKNLRDLITSKQKEQITILDGVLAAISTIEYKPLEIAA